MNDEYKIAAIIGITEAIKQYGVPSKFSPSIAIIIGAIISYAEKPNAQGILEGIVLGATITGGYAVVKRGGSSITSSLKKQPATDLEPDDYRGV
ncbi:hypothetical protein KKA95_00945 [Patescibacteria group bacterium]|nr:hypothetical protein [Patescibacteria group bacterium]